jgi:hypothetical protein
MLSFIDLTYSIIKRMKENGWIDNVGHAMRKNPRLLERGSSKIMLVGPISVNEITNITSQFDDFFKSLIKKINKITSVGSIINEILVQGGGTHPIPDFFQDYCKENNIKLTIFNEESIESIINSYH